MENERKNPIKTADMKNIYTFLHFKCRFSTSHINTCFWDSIIRYSTSFVKKCKINSKEFHLTMVQLYPNKLVKDEMSNKM